MPKAFTNAGTSVDSEGYTNYRMAMDIDSRTAMLEYNGHTEIEFYKLPRPMLRSDAIAWLNKKGIYAGVDLDQTEPVATRTVARRRVGRPVAAPVVPELTPAKQRRYDAAQAELAEAEKLAERAKAKLDRIAA